MVYRRIITALKKDIVLTYDTMITTAAVRDPDFALASRGVVVVSGRKKN